jgi:glutaredoxin/cytochrome c biogenesis protein CcdA
MKIKISKLKKLLILPLLALFILPILLSGSLKAQNLNIYLFWGDGCPHCTKEKDFLAETLPKYPGVKLNDFEIYHNKTNVELVQKVATQLNANFSGVPFLVIGDKTFVGYNSGTTNKEIKNRINECLKIGCPDSVAKIVNNQSAQNKETKIAISSSPTPIPTPSATESPQKKIINLPFIGEINAFDYSLPLLTIFIGALDGFNPCAMWTLLFLISILLGLKDRKRMWLLGGTFILVSGFSYFLFMAAWLKLILFIGFVTWVRILIGGFALAGGGYSLKKGLTNKDGGCDVTGGKKRQATFSRIREIVNRNSLLLALIGIVLLAFAVNLVELVCSAGLPAVYTQVLALSDLATWQYYSYLLLYIFFFMLDDLIIFFIAMSTLRLTGISTKYSRYSNIIGGVLMIILGLLLIFKPEILMLG